MDTDLPSDRLSRARFRELQRLTSAKGRRENNQFLIDGEKLVRDALAASAPVTEILSVEPALWRDAPVAVTQISEADAERLSDTRTPQGHLAVVRDELAPLAVPDGERWQVVALDGVQDAGNVGGIIRSAAAFGVDAVLVGQGSANPTHPRTTRAATGAWFRVRVARSNDLYADLQKMRDAGAAIIAADRDGSALDDLVDDVQLASPVVWVFGSEGAGVSAALSPLIDQLVAVPIADGVDSLNVNVAAGIILHHSHRLRRNADIDGSSE